MMQIMENDLISREALKKAVRESYHNNPHPLSRDKAMHRHEHNHMIALIEAAPAVEIDKPRFLLKENGELIPLNRKKENLTMTFNKPPEWGSRFQFPENAEVSMDGFVVNITEKMACEMVEGYDNFIAESIANAAREAGVSDLTVMNKAAILEAIEKQIPQRPDLEGDGYDDGGNLIYDTGYCPRCRCSYEVDYHSPKYCENCGQALDWSQEPPEED